MLNVSLVVYGTKIPKPILALNPGPYRPWAQAHTGPRPRPIPALGAGPAERSSYPTSFLKLPYCKNKFWVLDSKR